MADIPTANVAKATMVYTYNTQRIANVYFFSRAAPYTLAQLQSLAAILQGWDNTWLKPQRINQGNWVGCFTKAMDGPGSPVWDLIPILPQTGTATGAGYPAYVCLAVRHTTGLSGRSYRGRSYISMFPTSVAATVDTCSVALSNQLSTAFLNLRTLTAAGGHVFSIVSMYSGVDSLGRAIPRAAGIATPVLTSECGIGFDTQRHRKFPGVI